MGRKKFVLRPKLVKVERFKILSETWKEPGYKQFTSKWAKTNKLIFLKDGKQSRFCGHGLSVIVKTFFLKERQETTKSVHVTCMCCSGKKEKDMFSIYLPPEGSNSDRCMELGGVLSDKDIWRMLLLPLLGVKTKGGIKIT